MMTPSKDAFVDYAPALESRSIVTINPEYGHFINGAFTKGTNHFPSIDPSNEEVLSHIALGNAQDIDAAVDAARVAYESIWSKMSGKERGKYLYRIARILQERAREFAVLESLDNGKPIRESRDVDVPLAAAHFFYHAGWADKLDYAGLGNSPRPHGVAGQIIPWNFPILMLSWKIAPALAAGNTVVLKPAESTSLTALLFAEVCQQADLPAGVVNIVTGDGSTGAARSHSPAQLKLAKPSPARLRRRRRRQPSNSAGRRQTLSSTMPRLMKRWRGLSMASSSTKVTCAVRDLAYSYKKILPTNSWQN
jgi:aldehyde dehydrogenase (NAD+)